MISNDVVFDSVRRGYNELEASNNSEIIDYFENIEPDAMVGHISNIKGIVFEQEVVNALNKQGFDAMMFEATNHPISDIALMSDGDIALEMQLKAIKQHFSYLEVPMKYRNRIGVSKVSGTLKGTIFAGVKILGWIFKYSVK